MKQTKSFMFMIKKILRFIFGFKKDETLSTAHLVQKIQRKWMDRIYTEHYNTQQILDKLRGMGIDKGSNIFIHSSWDSFNYYTGTPEELIKGLIELVGETGTIAMPAYPLLRKKLFNVKASVTKAGILPETFRHFLGVKRSANVRHSVVAIGPLAIELTNSHHLSKIRFDENSPYYKMCFNNFKVISFGLPTYVMGTVVHCIEATKWPEFPYFKSFYNFNELVEQHYIDINGTEQSYMEYKENVVTRNDYFRNQYLIWRYFDKKYFNKSRLSNLQIGCTDAHYTYKRLCELADKGIVLYVYPRFFK